LIKENIISTTIIIISHFGTLFSVLWIGFSSLRQVQIYETNFKLEIQEEDNALLSDIEIKQQLDRISKQIEEEKIFAEQDLNLETLAELVNIKAKELSTIINQGFGNNFYHFINSFRIQYFKQILTKSDYKNISIEGLSQLSGFKAKSTFYSAFKKTEGITPKQYETNKKQFD
jgi:AraC-like DNA-binding protein